MSKQQIQLDPSFLDDEEKYIIEAYRRGEFKSDPNFRVVKKSHEDAARNTKASKKAISIRLERGDLEQVKQLAERDGLGYQTHITSIIHKYLNGTLRRTD